MSEIMTPPMITEDEDGEEIVSFHAGHTWADVARWIAENPADKSEVLRLLQGDHPMTNQAPEREWQPIETAPKDGTKIRVVCVDESGKWWMPDVAWWDEESGRWENGDDYDEWLLTYWMPLPPPPTDTEGTE